MVPSEPSKLRHQHPTTLSTLLSRVGHGHPALHPPVGMAGPDSGQPALDTQLTTKGSVRAQEGKASARGAFQSWGMQAGGKACREAWEPSPVGLEPNPALFPADNKGENMAADTFASAMVPQPSLSPALSSAAHTDTEAQRG